MPFPDFVARMLGFIRGSGLFAAGLLEGHVEAFEKLRAACGWDAAAIGPSHNDPNARNLLFDGERLWLIDWETAFQNDPLVDLAIACDSFARTPELQASLLDAHFAGAPPPGVSERLQLVRRMTRLYYACLLLAGFARQPPAVPHADLSAPTPAEFQQQLADGRLREGDPRTLFVLGKMMLAWSA